MDKREILENEISNSNELEFRKQFYKTIKLLVENMPWLLDDVCPTDNQLHQLSDIQSSLLYFLKCKKEVSQIDKVIDYNIKKMTNFGVKLFYEKLTE